jgi:hypothetical protein
MRARIAPLPIRLALTAALAAAALACGRAPGELPTAQPTADTLAATPNAAGIPYGRYILIRHDGRLIALHVTAISQLGDRISFRWYAAGGDGRFTSPELLERDEGETVERPYTGRITLPGRLVLDWSRGSTEFGWLYWPEGPGDYAVYSLPFAELAGVAAGGNGGRWLTAEDFRR